MSRRAFNLRARRRGAVESQAASLVLLGIVGVLGYIVFVGRGGAPAITETAQSLSVSAHGYAQEIPYATIDSVTMRHGLDGVGSRRNGMQAGNTYAGRFVMKPYGEAMLFVDALREPLVVIHAKTGVTILSAADSLEAERLAGRLRAAMAR